ncbi:MAG: hypothetical protein A2Z24_01795 [Candidatus Woykebacteria bacterium RBG_16_44_10]|uniref:Uncharacterized protein n=1 Tax=Candidatus Woykebacteria bacterium RBG_16_44_10 TaxID=1802597 RepID=A0A1G1WEQ4_9BACT|nr:MAG: hypothetical protein A2Z24_01795 [Candidatus Woykebacteria bacterium RBG_16_44_10]
MDAAKITAVFVDLALRHDRWDEIKELPDDELRVLFKTVVAAGFEPKSVVLGKLRGNYLEQDGSRTGETYPINGLCPVKVISQEGGDHYFATGWLDCALRRVVGGAKNGEDRECLIEVVRSEIERSIPLLPIQLTPEGDLLREYPRSPLAFGLAYFVDHVRDDWQLSTCVGVHAYCHGWMDRHRATATHDVIVCRGCHLRVLFPKKIRTYGQLRHYMETQRVQVPA